jgi:hypothetical protein
MSLKPQKDFFSKVKVARELLKEKAAEILEDYLDIVQKAKDAGDYETAAKSLQWLIEHMPEEEGHRLVEVSVDKKQQVVEQGPKGPDIRIGIAVGGLTSQKALPKPSDVQVEVIENE